MDDVIEIETPSERSKANASAFEVFRSFLILGLTSFGGPVAHIGYFRKEFVARRAWVAESTFADLVALCQFLPGPGSSQLCFVLGLGRLGWLGAILAWAGFTLPSAIFLFAFARLSSSLSGATAIAAIHGLKLVAVAVVAQAVWGMAKTLTPDFRRASLAMAAAAIVLIVSGSFAQVSAIAMGGLIGVAICRDLAMAQTGFLKPTISPVTGLACLAIFVVVLFGAPLLATEAGNHVLAVFNAFYRTGALVFGGGHVVLPLLSDAVVKPGWISESSFLTGYGAAQAVPGPLFTVSAYLGASLKDAPNGLIGAGIAIVGIFLPGMLLITGTLPFWDNFRATPNAQAAICGVNAAVVGILGAALYDPLWKTSIESWQDVALASMGFILLTLGNAPPWSVVIGVTAATIGVSWLH
jgi:chromate transporter